MIEDNENYADGTLGTDMVQIQVITDTDDAGYHNIWLKTLSSRQGGRW